MQERQRRITEYLLSYWEELRGDRPFPAESDVNPGDLEDIWESCFLVEVKGSEDKGLSFKYAYLGGDLIDAFGDDMTGREIFDELVDPKTRDLVRNLTEMVELGEPTIREAEFTNHNNMLIKYRKAMVPLSDDGKTINFILGGMKWRAF